MNCDRIKEVLPDYLTDNLEEIEKSEFHAHLTACEVCKAEVDSLEALWLRMETLPGEQPAISLRARFYTMLEAYMQGRGESPEAATKTWPGSLSVLRWAWRPAFALALAVVTLVVGIGIGRTIPAARTADGEVAKLREEVHTMYQLVTISLLQQQSASERLRGLSWSQRVAQPDPQVLSALFQVLNYDPNVNVRLAAVDALSQFSEQSHVREGLIQAMMRQPSPLVQIALIDLMVALQERRSIDSLKSLMQDQKLNETVKQRAQWGLKQLS